MIELSAYHLNGTNTRNLLDLVMAHRLILINEVRVGEGGGDMLIELCKMNR